MAAKEWESGADWPFVTILVPLLDEAQTIDACLRAIAAQDYPPDCMELLAVDGGSTDGTREVVARFAELDRRIRLLDNPRRLTSAGLNVGIKVARRDVIIRVDGHTILAPDYVRQCVRALQRTGADNVGGPMRPMGTTLFGQTIALAMQSRFGVGDAHFHYAQEPRYVDTVYLGAFRRDVFDRAGLFDESLVRN